MDVKCAVVFKTYSWDAFVERQFDRYRAVSASCDLFVSVDETNGSVGPIRHDRVIRTSNAELIESGLPNRFERGSLIWWNADYPHYQFLSQHDEYDYYVFVEYDSLVQRDIMEIVTDIASRKADFVAMPIRCDIQSWFWTRFHRQTYPLRELRGALNCITIFSNRALRLLDRRRREMARDPKVRYWPLSEAFVATEIQRAGYKMVSLEEYGTLDHFDWYPPTLEDDLPDLRTYTFVHPILDKPRYIQSVLKSGSTVLSYLRPNSALRQTLARVPAQDYMPLLPAAARRRLWVLLQEKLMRFWLKRFVRDASG